MNQYVSVVGLKVKRSSFFGYNPHRDRLTLFLVPDNETRAGFVKAVRSYSEDLDLRTAKVIGAVKAQVTGTQRLSFDEDIEA